MHSVAGPLDRLCEQTIGFVQLTPSWRRHTYIHTLRQGHPDVPGLCNVPQHHFAAAWQRRRLCLALSSNAGSRCPRGGSSRSVPGVPGHLSASVITFQLHRCYLYTTTHNAGPAASCGLDAFGIVVAGLRCAASHVSEPFREVSARHTMSGARLKAVTNNRAEFR